ncbi:hypothetical protein MHYP_G00103900 [Metynnis hypsauchen]
MYSNVYGKFLLLIRELNPQDSAVYRFGVGTKKHKDIKLTVQSDFCCGGIKGMKAHPGETTTFKCNYPEEFIKNYKYFYKFGDLFVKEIIYTKTESQKEQRGRFSIFDDRRHREECHDEVYQEALALGFIWSSILPLMGMASIWWELQGAIQVAVLGKPNPGGRPPDSLYVPTPVRLQVIQRGHASTFAAHPDDTHNLEFQDWQVCSILQM